MSQKLVKLLRLVSTETFDVLHAIEDPYNVC